LNGELVVGEDFLTSEGEAIFAKGAVGEVRNVEVGREVKREFIIGNLVTLETFVDNTESAFLASPRETISAFKTLEVVK